VADSGDMILLLTLILGGIITMFTSWLILILVMQLHVLGLPCLLISLSNATSSD
jgi:hypothetical protein